MTISVGKKYVVQHGQSLSFIDEAAFNFDPSPYYGATVTNKGRVTVHTDAASLSLYGVYGGHEGSQFLNKKYFEVSSTGAASSVTGFDLGQTKLYNDGVIKIVSAGSAVGIRGGYWLNNTGSIRVTGHDPVGIHTISDLSSQNDGLISVTAVSGRAVGLEGVNSFGTFFNNGSVTVTDHTPGLDSAVIDFGDFNGGEWLVNTGVLKGDYAILGHAASSYSINEVTITNSGQVIGRVQLDVLSVIQFHNTGLIVGDVYLGTGADVFDGSGGTTQGTIYGGGGDNTITGGLGPDTINTADGSGKDRLDGGPGQDSLTGGAGADTFAFTSITDSAPGAPDTIHDFLSGDHIDLSAIDANLSAAGDQAFHVGGGGGHAGDIVVTYNSSQDVTTLSLYVDKNATVDGRVLLTGDHSGLGASDFVL